MNGQKVQSNNSIYNITLTDAEGNKFKLEKFKSKNLLIVNVASRCGYTSQYNDLQRLHDQHGKEVQILAIPCNDFGGQEPGTNVQIKNFCEVNFNINFPMTAKTVVKGNGAHPFYKWVNDELGWRARPKWNFHKYLIGRDGSLQGSFSSMVSTESSNLRNKITQVLKK